MAAADDDLLVHPGPPRWQRNLGGTLAGLEFGPIASWGNRDVEFLAGVFQRDIGNIEFGSCGSQRG
jgi:hypothetical protein